ncbi:Holliday junction resolvase RecU [Mycoplasma marinum]|uniref:Holliday junction resolvase RecU n=1 Tax=Mycoplasma marinum TaxID=1937190 RepID=A0A4R0XYB7_9MOLU|nr:Holliday junction resolvase RecU [Mycoplasma marinum]TCG12059.1 Holliday junction resolvase RecU [Mycoplasma marinum]
MKNRGMMLESILNKTISIYKENGVGIFHKKELPITFGKINKTGKLFKVENAYIKSKSTTDYYGILKGRFVSFEAKSTNEKSLPLKNIKRHQHQYLKDIELHGGIAFYIISFKSYDKYFLISTEIIDNLSKKSLSLEIANEFGIELDLIFPGILDFAAWI